MESYRRAFSGRLHTSHWRSGSGRVLQHNRSDLREEESQAGVRSASSVGDQDASTGAFRRERAVAIRYVEKWRARACDGLRVNKYNLSRPVIRRGFAGLEPCTLNVSAFYLFPIPYVQKISNCKVSAESRR